MTLTEQILSTLPGNVLGNLQQADRLWSQLREGSLPQTQVVQLSPEPLGTPDYDVIVCGGTLGIFIAAAIAQQGWKVALLERGHLRGREQEWNISRHELQVFVELELLTPAELEQAIATEYNPARIQFGQTNPLWVRDVLNIGVDPVYLLETLKHKFIAWGGQLLEHTPFSAVTVHQDGITVTAEQPLTARLLIDAMGHFSPIVQQARQGRSPDGICLVVGGCAQGFTANESGDLLVSFTPMQNQCQYFWEAFPARDGRTTYLFTYLDVHPQRPSLEQLFEDYLQLLPEYQGIDLAQLQWQRALFGLFPCYRQSPLQPAWNRILQVGDSSGNQSPLSFGGFGSMVRHLKRLSQGLQEVLQQDLLDREALACLQPYQPGLSATWLFQQTMSARVDQTVAPDQVNHLLATVFQVMAQSGEGVLKPFLQDIVQFPALTQTLLQVARQHPTLVFGQIIPYVGWQNLLDWMGHYCRLGAYYGLYPLGRQVEPWLKSLSPAQQYYCRQWIQAWEYGAGHDYRAQERSP